MPPVASPSRGLRIPSVGRPWHGLGLLGAMNRRWWALIVALLLVDSYYCDLVCPRALHSQRGRALKAEPKEASGVLWGI